MSVVLVAMCVDGLALQACVQMEKVRFFVQNLGLTITQKHPKDKPNKAEHIGHVSPTIEVSRA